MVETEAHKAPVQMYIRQSVSQLTANRYNPNVDRVSCVRFPVTRKPWSL